MKVNLKIKNKNGEVMQEQFIDTVAFGKRIKEIDEMDFDFENNPRFLNLSPEQQAKLRPIIGDVIQRFQREKFEKKRWISRVNYFNAKRNGNN